MNMRCPVCGANLFHVQEDDDGKQYLICWKGRCCWKAEIKPPIVLASPKPRNKRTKALN